MEKAAFLSLNSSPGWLGISASPFYAIYAIYLQQKLPTAAVETMLSQWRYLRHVEKRGTKISNTNRPIAFTISGNVAAFSDAGPTDEIRQLSYLAGILIPSLQKN